MSAYQFVLLLILVVLLIAALALFLPTPGSGTQSGPPRDVRDDDRYWFLDIFYNNPDDPDVFVPKRFVPGRTVNIGHPQGRLFLIGMLLVPVVLALLGALFPGSLTTYGCHPSGCHLLP